MAIGVLGAGNFARMVLLPALAATGKLQLATLCTAGGVSAAGAAGFDSAAGEAEGRNPANGSSGSGADSLTGPLDAPARLGGEEMPPHPCQARAVRGLRG